MFDNLAEQNVQVRTLSARYSEPDRGHCQVRRELAGFDQLSQTSGVVEAIISSPRGARASIDVESRGTVLRALGGGVSDADALKLDTTDLVSSKGNFIDGRELAFDPALTDFTDV